MYVLIIGGGRTGSHLASSLAAEGHEVRVIENRPTALANLHRELPTELIYEGDGTDPQVLEAADVRRANVLVAVSSEDADNLVAASLARHQYGIPQRHRPRQQSAQCLALHARLWRGRGPGPG